MVYRFSQMSSPEHLRNGTDGLNANPPSSRATYEVESTPNGDVYVVDHFDSDENSNGGRNSHIMSPGGSENTRPSASATRKTRRHRRDLSAQLLHSVKITEGEETDRSHPLNSQTESEDAIPLDYMDSISPGAGQKHRRMFSGGTSNPPLAHRRINSIGNSAAVERGVSSHYTKEVRKHHKTDSAGLDILSAAADVSKEEIAAAVGANPAEIQLEHHHHWEQPIGPSARVHHRTGGRVGYADYAVVLPASMKPPPNRVSTQLQHYHHGPHGMQGPQPPGYLHGRPSSHHMGFHASPHPPSFYYHPQNPVHHAPRSMGPAYRTPYPVQQYQRHDIYMKPNPPPIQPAPSAYHPTGESSQPLPTTVVGVDKGSPEESKFNKPKEVARWKGPATNQGVQTFVTTMGVGDGTRTIEPSDSRNASTNTESNDSDFPDSKHHRKISSFSIFAGAVDDPLKSRGHHRKNSSSVSFFQVLDTAWDPNDAVFLRNLQDSTPGYCVPTTSTSTQPAEVVSKQSEGEANSTTKLASGGTSKRVRRKCTVDGCENRVVQGGLCISHGAKRKTCKHPGCNKNVKKAGLCSTHGPARKRCETEGCEKVAVQGGRCITHGAKKKLCSVLECQKQAILGGMCKKHHDQTQKESPVGPAEDERATATPVSSEKSAPQLHPSKGKAGHVRGLSIFHDLSSAAVESLLTADGPEPVGCVDPVEERSAPITDRRCTPVEENRWPLR